MLYYAIYLYMLCREGHPPGGPPRVACIRATETMLADLRARAARACPCKGTSSTTTKVPLMK